MTLHAIRGVPWLVVLMMVAPVPALLRIVEQWPYAMWPLEGIAVGLVAAAAGWCFDETPAALVDTLPRSLRWRTCARLVGVGAVLAVWLVSVAWTSPAFFGRTGHVAWQGVAAAAGATAYVTWRRSRGTPNPGRPAAVAFVSAALLLALTRPLDDSLPVFPYLSSGPWEVSAVAWTTIATASVVVLGVLLAEPVRRRSRNGHYFG